MTRRNYLAGDYMVVFVGALRRHSRKVFGSKNMDVWLILSRFISVKEQ